MSAALPGLSRRSFLVGGSSLATVGLIACSGGGTGDPVSSRSNDPEPTATALPATEPSSREPTTTTSPPSGAYVPPPDAAGEWETTTAADAGLTDEGVAALLALVGGGNSQSLVLLHDGRIVAEQYWMGADASTVRDVASVQKSVVSTLMGMVRDLGGMSFADTVTSYLGAGWSNADTADESVITLHHLMTMTSGLHPRTLRKAAAPGTVWDYNTDAYQKLRQVLETATSMGIDDLSRETVFDGLGMSPLAAWAERPVMRPDAVGDQPWGLQLTARDMARYGLFAMRNGSWGGLQMTPDSWFAEAWTPFPQKGDYGYLWWLIGRGRLHDVGAPTDAVAALGAQDQKIYVVPSAGLVLARQGDAAQGVAEAGSAFDGVLVKALVAARA